MTMRHGESKKQNDIFFSSKGFYEGNRNVQSHLTTKFSKNHRSRDISVMVTREQFKESIDTEEDVQCSPKPKVDAISPGVGPLESIFKK
jgi:hypothetical protein